MALASLLSVLAPPERPVACGRPGDWASVEQAIGTALPQDYKEFIGKYGGGGINDFLGVLSPFGKSVNLVSYSPKMHKLLGRLGVPIFPEPGGLFFIGGDENGNNLFWKTVGEPSSWSIVYASEEFADYEEFKCDLTDFLAGWVSGRIRPQLIEHLDVFAEEKPQFVPSKCDEG